MEDLGEQLRQVRTICEAIHGLGLKRERIKDSAGKTKWLPLLPFDSTEQMLLSLCIADVRRWAEFPEREGADRLVRHLLPRGSLRALSTPTLVLVLAACSNVVVETTSSDDKHNAEEHIGVRSLLVLQEFRRLLYELRVCVSAIRCRLRRDTTKKLPQSDYQPYDEEAASAFTAVTGIGSAVN